MIRSDQYQEVMRTRIKYVLYVHVLQTKRIFRQFHCEIARIWLLWHSFVWVVIGWHLPAGMRHPGLVPDWRTTCLLRAGPRDIIVNDRGIIVLLLGWWWLRLWWGAASGRPPRRLWIKPPVAFRPLMCADGRGELGRGWTGITGRMWRGPGTLIALGRVWGHARVGRTYVRRVNSWTPSRLSCRCGRHVRGLHCGLGLRFGREKGGGG